MAPLSSDSEDDANDTPDRVVHDDFDPATLYAEYTEKNAEPMEMASLLEEAKKFGDSHRHLINKFMTEPSMRTKKMNLIFARHVSTIKLRKHPEAVMKIKSTPELSKQLSKTLVKTMNNDKGKDVSKGFRPWRFVISTDEKTPVEYVTITGILQNSTILSDASVILKSERSLFLAILECMMKRDGTMRLSEAQKLTDQEHCSMPASKCDIFLNKMIRQKYFHVNGDVIEITPRTLVELEPWLRVKMPTELRICVLCHNIICRPVFMAECNNCHAETHFNCFKNSTLISNQDHVECSKCKENLTLDEAEKQVKARKRDGTLNRKRKSPTDRVPRVSEEEQADDVSSSRAIKTEDSE